MIQIGLNLKSVVFMQSIYFLVIKQLLILGHPNNFISIKIVVQLLWPSLSLNGF